MSEMAVDLTFANSSLAKTYVEFRPLPPETLIQHVLEFTKEKRPLPLEICVDVGCGSGQTTMQYSQHFQHVLGIDVSSEQLELARNRNSHCNVSFKKGTAESIPVHDASVDLVTCCASVHWFDLKKFYAEVNRVLKPGGVLACYSYFGCSPLFKGKSLRSEFLEIWDSLDKYWTEGHEYLRTEYATLPVCYPENLYLKGLSVEHDATLDTFLGYICSFSAFSKMKAAEGEDVANIFLEKSRKKLVSAVGHTDDDPPMRRRYDYFLRVFRKPLQ
ncbi:hypothetical protein SK128_003823 [Halocaridina rubra]|uniref:Methyltransferase type 11 domain-containing protein n=1 Tax=Halocaridina rubra TaxID=373956 RepID=A0AAN8WYP5_HALRR